LGLKHVLKQQPPDLILSGVNHGANLAEDVAYSGTIAGAMEGTLLGVRSIALSQSIGFDADGLQHWETALQHAPGLIKTLIAEPWPPAMLINVNFPNVEPDKVNGIAVTSQGRRDSGLHLEQRHDTWGHPYFWVGFEHHRADPPPGTDLRAIMDGKISITPLTMNLTHAGGQQHLTKVFSSAAEA
jgi:5'-nucleotidase